MIKDKLENAEIYTNISEKIKQGFEWLKKADLKILEDGKYFIDGESFYANIQTYETKSDAKYEAHRKYIDIQYMIKGAELVGVTDISNCKTCVEYDSQKDLEFFDITVEEDLYSLREGEFLLFFPQDAHKPSIDYKEKNIVKKVVVKVPLD